MQGRVSEMGKLSSQQKDWNPQRQERTCQGPGKDTKVTAVQEMVKDSRNLAFVE